MNEITNTTVKKYDLEERTFNFAKRINEYVNKLSKTITNIENGKQLARSAGSVGANYIEANNALSKKDFMMRIRISKKEAKESYFWIRLSEPGISQLYEKDALLKEAMELVKILGSIVEKSKV